MACWIAGTSFILALEGDRVERYYTGEKCEDLINNATYTGALEMINYTQETGGIKIFYNGSLIDSDVCEYCTYLQQTKL